jgi:hypothetical protein
MDNNSVFLNSCIFQPSKAACISMQYSVQGFLINLCFTYGPALAVSCGFVTQAGRYVAGPGWVGSERVAAGLNNSLGWVGPDGSNGLHGLHI